MLERIKRILNLQENQEVNSLLEIILDSTEKRLKLLLGGMSEVPAELDYILQDVCVARYNKIGSEGLSNHSIEGESMTWSSDDFKPYQADIQAYLSTQKKTSQGKVRFL